MSGLLGDVVEFFTTADNWWGRFGIVNRLEEHVRYSVSAAVVATVIALPVALWLGHLRRFGTLAINVANVGRALPSFALLALSAQIFGLDQLPIAGPTTAFIALVALGIPPILINGYSGMVGVTDDVRDAARGMGYTGREQALKVELPNALPLIIAGVRTSAVQIVATATLAAVVGAGGLGRYIYDGISTGDDAEVAAGAILVALLAIATEGVFAVLRRLALSPGLRYGRARSREDASVVPYLP
jgi:osmoprotectant transport system permease protein